MALRDFTEAWQQMNTDHYSPGVHKHKSTVPRHYMCLTFLSPSMVKQFALTEEPPHQIWSQEAVLPLKRSFNYLSFLVELHVEGLQLSWLYLLHYLAGSVE